jgi:quercetin dioxygenase-like cupin family protein
MLIATRYLQSSGAYSHEHLIEMGARMLAVANDLKRDAHILAEELRMDTDLVRSVLAGDASAADALSLLESMVHTYPVSMRELWVDVVDTQRGVLVMSAEASQRSGRVYERIDGRGQRHPYFEYRDTAMSRTGPYKPEYVRPLRHVDDTDPGNLVLAYNKGHLLHQLTFYVGDVNVYWDQGGQRHCRQMRTGDSSYMTPFVPHSFVHRGEDSDGYILAVTYTGEIEPAIATFNRQASVDLITLAGDARDESELFAALMARVLAAWSIDTEQLAEALIAQGIAPARSAQLANGEGPVPTGDERRSLGVCLGLNPDYFCIQCVTRDQEVAIKQADDDLSRAFPHRGDAAYEISDLASTPHQPNLRGFNVRVLADAGIEGVFRHHFHEYVYNYGQAPASLHVAGEVHELSSGASAYIAPFKPHHFTASAEDAHLLIVRVSGALSEAAIREYASYAPGRERVARETTRWF